MTPAQKYTAFKTILLREIRRFIRIWIQTVVPPARVAWTPTVMSGACPAHSNA